MKCVELTDTTTQTSSFRIVVHLKFLGFKKYINECNYLIGYCETEFMYIVLYIF